MADISLWLLAAPALTVAGLASVAWEARRTRAQDSSGPAGALPPLARGAAGPEVELTEPEQALLAHIRHVTAENPLADVISENGRHLADACRQAMPSAADLDIARLLLTQVAITHATLQTAHSPVDGLVICSDAMLGAVVDLTRLDEEVTTR